MSAGSAAETAPGTINMNSVFAGMRSASLVLSGCLLTRPRTVSQCCRRKR